MEPLARLTWSSHGPLAFVRERSPPPTVSVGGGAGWGGSPQPLSQAARLSVSLSRTHNQHTHYNYCQGRLRLESRLFAQVFQVAAPPAASAVSVLVIVGGGGTRSHRGPSDAGPSLKSRPSGIVCWILIAPVHNFVFNHSLNAQPCRVLLGGGVSEAAGARVTPDS